MAELKPYRTEDLGLAAYLHVKGLQILKPIPTRDPRRLAFIFVDQKDREKLVDEYFSGEGQVPAQKYFYAIKDVRSLLSEPFTNN